MEKDDTPDEQTCEPIWPQKIRVVSGLYAFQTVYIVKEQDYIVYQFPEWIKDSRLIDSIISGLPDQVMLTLSLSDQDVLHGPLYAFKRGCLGIPLQAPEVCIVRLNRRYLDLDRMVWCRLRESMGVLKSLSLMLKDLKGEIQDESSPRLQG